MADFRTALVTRLQAIDGMAGVKVHWVIVPQGTARPYVRLQVISDPRPEHLKGYDTTRQTRVQADIFGTSYGQGVQLAEKITISLANPVVVGGVQFGHTKAEGPTDLGEDTSAGYVHRAQLDLIVEHVTPSV